MFLLLALLYVILQGGCLHCYYMLYHKVFKSRHTFEYLDTTDENVCNWMMFIRLASTLFEQNLIAYQHNGNIYFSSISVSKVFIITNMQIFKIHC